MEVKKSHQLNHHIHNLTKFIKIDYDFVHPLIIYFVFSNLKDYFYAIKSL